MSSLFQYLIVILLGLIAGSFLNCVIYRLEQNKSFLKGRSFCPKCKHVLAWQDLVPVFSFCVLRGECRYCRNKISWQYPLVELFTALIFLAVFYYQLPVWAYIASLFLVVIFVYDLKHYLILDKVIYSAIVLALLVNLKLLASGQFAAFGYFIFSALGAAGFFFAIVLMSRGKWMGVGDIKLAFFMGLVLGWPNILVALFLAFISGAIMGLGLISLKKKTLKSEVPFGPFLVIGTLAAMFWGLNLVNWYLSFFYV